MVLGPWIPSPAPCLISSLSGTGSQRGPCVLYRHDDDPLFVLKVDIDRDHPAPRSQHETKACPLASKLWPQPGETPEGPHAALEALFGVLWQAVTADQSIEVGRSRPRDFDRANRQISSSAMVRPVLASSSPCRARSNAPGRPSRRAATCRGSGSASSSACESSDLARVPSLT